ncbi:MAG TPA: hypothetical protein VHS33_01170 [Sphingomicrobium sp.]|jgi:hypothetical protein|nr:hypothetical protein [Sphingomicrobium sp.]
MEPAFNQAEDMLRRVSPEGRAIAHRERIERQRRTTRRLALCAVLGLFAWLVLFGIAELGFHVGQTAIAAATLAVVVGCAVIFLGLRPRKVSVASLPSLPLADVPAKVAEWLELQRRLLPAPAHPLVDSLYHRLSALGPQLESVEPNGPGGIAVRKLIAVELPDLVDRYQNIPSAAERMEANRQLIDGLSIIDGEVGRLTEDLASGSFDALATQNRYLQLKYDTGLNRL